MVKRGKKEWVKIVEEFYNIEPKITISKYCKSKKVSQQQFHYNKKRYLEQKNIDDKTDVSTVFQKVELKSDKNSEKLENNTSNVKISIGNAKIEIPSCEKETIIFL